MACLAKEGDKKLSDDRPYITSNIAIHVVKQTRRQGWLEEDHQKFFTLCEMGGMFTIKSSLSVLPLITLASHTWRC